MNNSTDDPQVQINRVAYAIGFSTGIISLLFMITLSAYFCTRATGNNPPSQNGSAATDRELAAMEGGGVDEVTLCSYPKILYQEAKLQKGDLVVSSASSCSICLGEYEDTDVLRLLPACGHFFHLDCVDFWLRRHPTCPVCRDSPMPTPVATPPPAVSTPLATC